MIALPHRGSSGGGAADGAHLPPIKVAKGFGFLIVGFYIMDIRLDSSVRKVKLVSPPVALLVLSLFLFVPSLIYFGNTNSFRFSYGEIVLHYALPMLAVGIALLSVAAVLPAKILVRYAAVIFMIGLLMWVQTNFMVRDYGVFDGTIISWEKYITYDWVDVVVWLSALAAALIFARPMVRLLSVASYALIILYLVNGVFAWGNQPENLSQEKASLSTSVPGELVNYSRHKNIIHILMDHFQTDIFYELVRDNEWWSKLSGFTLYQDNLGASLTTLALPSIFSGAPYDQSISPEEYYLESLRENSFTNVLYNNGYAVNITTYFSFPNENVTALYRTPTNKGGVLKDEKLLEAALLVDVSLFRALPQPLKKIIYNNNNWRTSEMFSLPVGIKPISDINFLGTYATLIKPELEQPAYHFIGLYTPHPPYVMSSTGKYAGVLEPTRENYKNQAHYTLAAVIDFLDELRKRNLYDNALIILQSDHGAEFPPIIDGNEIDLGRVRVPGLLAIKPPQRQEAMRVSSAQTSITDVAATILDVADLAWDGGGKSILKLDEATVRERIFAYQTGNNFRILGSIYDKNAWHSIAPGQPRVRQVRSYSWGSVIQFGDVGNAFDYKKVGWSFPVSGYEWTNGHQVELTVPVDPVTKDILFTITGMPFVSPGKVDRQRMRLLVGGEAVADWALDEFRGYQLSATIPRHLVRSPLQIMLEFPDAQRPKDLGISGDARLLGLAVQQITMTPVEASPQ